MNNTELSNQPYKGTKDWLPEDFLVQEYIFNTWRQVCKSFGYEEYLTPLLENAEVYRAKSGEDIGGKELFTLTDLAGRELAIRPEMTPSVTRMVSRVYNEWPKPIRLFSIANYCRNERPQKGRTREFWQLNIDIFGDESINSDVEMLTIAVELMLAFNPPEEAFYINYNNRKLINAFLDVVLGLPQEEKQNLVRLLDKYEKFENDDDFVKVLLENGYGSDLGGDTSPEGSSVTMKASLQKASGETIDKILKFLNSTATTLLSDFPELEGTEGANEVTYIQEAISDLGYDKYFNFKPNVIRGFDYYDGLIFEVFDANRDNPRSLFGGGRYNGLGELFGITDMPAVGFAPGNETFRIFLENWDLLPKDNRVEGLVYLPLLEDVLITDLIKVSNILRQNNYRVKMGLKTTNITAALREANKNNIKTVVIYGKEEKDNKRAVLKNMDTSSEEILEI